MALSPKAAPTRQKSNARNAVKAPRPRTVSSAKKPRKSVARNRRTPPPFWSRHNLLLISLEWSALTISVLLGTMLALGSSAGSFSGSGFFANLLPFAAGVAFWVIAFALFLLVWIKWRPFLRNTVPSLPAILAVTLSGSMAWYIFHDGFAPVFSHFRSLVGGKQQAARMTLEHQVYAAYRRHSQPSLEKMIARAMDFDADIRQASDTYGLDAHVLQGIAAAESSFRPRNSLDGGQGLFQITAVPKQILQEVRGRLGVKNLDISNARHNTYIAAATMRHYLSEMKGDLFLGLLAYNIGPRNGGLRFIMQQYGANDFITMQPYLKELPRDYPIRVLSYALAFKIWQQNGKLLAYQEGDNAAVIQRVGIPGLTPLF